MLTPEAEEPEVFAVVERDDVDALASLISDDPQQVHATSLYKGTPLHCARSRAAAGLLIEAGADVDARGWMAARPLHSAADRGDAEVVAALLEADADPHAERDNQDQPLHWAANAEVVHLLVDAGADVMALDGFGQQPLHWAARWSRPAAIQAIIERGARIDVRCDDGKTALHLAVQTDNGHDPADDLAATKQLVDMGAALEVVDDTGDTPLRDAVVFRNAGIVDLLLKAGADPNSRSPSGDTAYHRAEGEGYEDIRRLLEPHMDGYLLGRETKLERQLPRSEMQLYNFAVHPRMKRAVSACKHGRIVGWSMDDGPAVSHFLQTDHAAIGALALHPNRDLIACCAWEPKIEFRRWSDLAVVDDLPVPGHGGPSAIAYSPDGRWFAVADNSYEEVLLLDAETLAQKGSTSGGECTIDLAFSPDSRTLAVVCHYQGGGGIDIVDVSESGELTVRHEPEIHQGENAPEVSGDLQWDLAFSPDGHELALFETHECAGVEGLDGWRGSVVLIDARTGEVRWSRTIDARVTGDPRSIEDAGYECRFVTELAWCGDELYCGADLGVVVVLDGRSGTVVRRVQTPTDSTIGGFVVDPATSRVWAVPVEGPPMLLRRASGG